MRSGATMDLQVTPSWLAEGCPAWCTREHHEDDHPEDRRHQSDGTLIAVHESTTAIPVGSARSVEVAAYLDQPVAEGTCWLRVESLDSPRMRLALTAESARSLAGLLGGLLDRLE